MLEPILLSISLVLAPYGIDVTKEPLKTEMKKAISKGMNDYYKNRKPRRFRDPQDRPRAKKTK